MPHHFIPDVWMICKDIVRVWHVIQIYFKYNQNAHYLPAYEIYYFCSGYSYIQNLASTYIYNGRSFRQSLRCNEPTAADIIPIGTTFAREFISVFTICESWSVGFMLIGFYTENVSWLQKASPTNRTMIGSLFPIVTEQFYDHINCSKYILRVYLCDDSNLRHIVLEMLINTIGTQQVKLNKILKKKTHSENFVNA